MIEVRFHGRGGQGVVKSAQTVVSAVVDTGAWAHFIPFFGVERKGSPVYGFLRIDDADINLKCQVYEPEILVILDDTLLPMPQTYDGLREGGTVLLNTPDAARFTFPSQAAIIAAVDATAISLKHLGQNIPNTAMLGAFARTCDSVNWQSLQRQIEKNFDANNLDAALEAYESVQIVSKVRL